MYRPWVWLDICRNDATSVSGVLSPTEKIVARARRALLMAELSVALLVVSPPSVRSTILRWSVPENIPVAARTASNRLVLPAAFALPRPRCTAAWLSVIRCAMRGLSENVTSPIRTPAGAFAMKSRAAAIADESADPSMLPDVSRTSTTSICPALDPSCVMAGESTGTPFSSAAMSEGFAFPDTDTVMVTTGNARESTLLIVTCVAEANADTVARTKRTAAAEVARRRRRKLMRSEPPARRASAISSRCDRPASPRSAA